MPLEFSLFLNVIEDDFYVAAKKRLSLFGCNKDDVIFTY